jgi:hypothetical protein
MSAGFTFSGELWEYPGDSPWVFVTVPGHHADDIRASMPPRPGFGSVKVSARVGRSRWMTSLFPDRASESFLLPVKRVVREREALAPGDVVEVTLRVLEA